MKNRLELAQYFEKLGFTKGAEIGVSQGIYSKVLLDTIPNLQLLSVDAWTKWRISGALYEETKKLLAPYPGSTIVRKKSMEAVKDIPQESLDFVFIDAEHRYPHVIEDVREWSKKVRIGGIVSGHDYFHPRFPDVTKAVDEYVNEYGYKLEIVGADLMNPNIEEILPSWYFLKDK